LLASYFEKKLLHIFRLIPQLALVCTECLFDLI